MRKHSDPQSVEAATTRYYEELRRYNYVTPTSYLELLTTFIRLVKEKREELETMRERLKNGLDKLNTTAKEVEVMERELVDLQPVLKKTAIEVRGLEGSLPQGSWRVLVSSCYPLEL
jgi:dynein heavy chain